LLVVKCILLPSVKLKICKLFQLKIGQVNGYIKNKTQYEYILYKIYLSHAVDKRKDKKVTLLLCQGHPIILLIVVSWARFSNSSSIPDNDTKSLYFCFKATEIRWSAKAGFLGSRLPWNKSSKHFCKWLLQNRLLRCFHSLL